MNFDAILVIRFFNEVTPFLPRNDCKNVAAKLVSDNHQATGGSSVKTQGTVPSMPSASLGN